MQLRHGTNTFLVTVEAQNGETRTYTVTIVRAKPVNPELNLNALSVEGYELATVFSPWKLNYSLKASDVSSNVITVQASTDVPGVKVTVNGAEVDSKGKARAYLKEGANIVIARVETADGKESKTYTISARYQSDSDAEGPKKSFDIRVNGNSKANVAAASQRKEDGKDIIQVIFNMDEMEKVLNGEQQRPVITVPVDARPDMLISELTGQLVKKMEQKEAVLDIRTGQVSYTIPAPAINIDEIGRKFGSDDALENIKVKVLMTMPSADQRENTQRGIEASGASLLAEPVDFNVVYTYEGKELQSERFTQFVERSLSLPEDTNYERITTGVRIQADGSLQHVPTFVYESEGKCWAKMRSYSNSLYSVICHSKEFAAIVIRSLGLTIDSGSTSFADVSASDWYSSIVATSMLYGLISGYEDGTFRPNQPISRAEAMLIIRKAWELAGKELPSSEAAEASLAKAADSAQVPGWARASIGTALSIGLMQGYEDGRMMPDRQITRAETAVILHKLLVRSELIQSKQSRSAGGDVPSGVFELGRFLSLFY